MSQNVFANGKKSCNACVHECTSRISKSSSKNTSGENVMIFVHC